MVVVCAIVVALGIFLSRRNSSVAQVQRRAVPVDAGFATNHLRIHARPALVSNPEGAEAVDSSDSERLAREKVEEYLRQHRRDVTSLLTAFHELKDTNYLREAATNFPNDPRLQWAVLANNAFPEDKRKWLDSFKTSSPSNSLANYMSAQDYFKSGQTNEALQEVFAAAGKPQFTDYSMDTMLDDEAYGRFAGRSPSEIHSEAMSAMSGESLPELMGFKNIARSIQEIQQQYAASGDNASVQNLAQAGVDLANRMTTGDGGKMLINQLVGVACEAIVLQPLDQNTSYDFLGGQTPAQWLADFKQQKAAMRDVVKNAEVLLPNMSEDQLNGYWEREKIYGELNAMKWLNEQQYSRHAQ